MHVVDPVEAWYEPARQFEQLVEDADDEYVPDKQLEQTVEDATEYKPAEQAPVTAVSPVVAQYDPPVHAVQLEEPVLAWYDPTRQLEHTVADEAEYDPEEQLPVTAERFVVAQYDPPGHAVQVMDPVED